MRRPRLTSVALARSCLGSAFSFPHTVYNAAGGYLSIFTGLKGFCATIANGTQAGLQSVICACDELRSGAVDAVLAAGTDENSENITEVYSHLPLPWWNSRINVPCR